MASDAMQGPAASGLEVTRLPAVTRIFVSGRFGHDAVSRLDAVLTQLPDEGTAPVLLRITSTEVEFGAGDALRELLARRRRIGRSHVAVWADEPLIRRWIPLALLHRTPPHGGDCWDAAVPAPS
ncbi:MAG TPA: hypothetical protein VHX15_00870 [Frankiaceae bacterium]|nr:hypothetical protein [Frankiaceae bacterium]